MAHKVTLFFRGSCFASFPSMRETYRTLLVWASCGALVRRMGPLSGCDCCWNSGPTFYYAFPPLSLPVFIDLPHFLCAFSVCSLSLSLSLSLSHLTFLCVRKKCIRSSVTNCMWVFLEVPTCSNELFIWRMNDYYVSESETETGSVFFRTSLPERIPPFFGGVRMNRSFLNAKTQLEFSSLLVLHLTPLLHAQVGTHIRG